MIETFSRRRKDAQQAASPDVFRYDEVPAALRNQVIWIWREALGPYYDNSGRALSNMDALHHALHGTYPHQDQPISNLAWDLLARIMAEESGLLDLGSSVYADSSTKCCSFFLASNALGALDILELSFRIIEGGLSTMPVGQRTASGITCSAEDAVVRLNARFRQHGIGYEYVDGELCRVDETYVHSEAVKPALLALTGPDWDGPREEFHSAVAHYRKDEFKDAIVDAGNALESTMKVICNARNWTYPATASAWA
jgi:hypothetical protein